MNKWLSVAASAVLMVSIVGCNGTDGKDGTPGAQGEKGVPGQDGTNGKDGVDGKDGTNGKDAVSENYSSPRVGDLVFLSNIDFPLATAKFSNGFELKAKWGIGSGATHKASDANDTFYTITDRGVNIKCKDDEDITGMNICDDGKIFPFPNFTPTIIKFQLDGDDKAIVTEVIPLKDRDGKEISGVSNPISNFTEQAYDINGNKLDLDINGVDSEAVTALEDGTFWIAEEYTSSILHIAADGKVIKRLVPAGLEDEYATATYDVEGTLPAIIAKRHENRGIESIAVSPDQNYLYFMMQSPLANPDEDAYKTSRNVRLYKMEIANPSNIKEYLYVMDKPDTFLKDNEKKALAQNKVKLSEMETLGDDKIMIDERGSATTKLYTVDLSTATPVPADKSANLELNATGVTPLTKTKVFDTDLAEGYPNKIEGIAHLGGTKFLLINDNDFGIEGDKTIAKIADIDVTKKVDKKQTHGRVVFFDENATFEKSVKVGILPDMVTYTHYGKKVLVADEGEVVGNENLDAPLYDPYGTVSIINTSDYSVKTVDFKSVTDTTGMKIRKGAEIARDFEPEYIAVNENDTAAYVTLQESNAVAKIDLTTDTLDKVFGLGFKDLSKSENAMDYKKDGDLNITTLPSGVYGMYQPDTIKTYRVNGVDYFVTANEGDDRDDFYKETVHANDLNHTGIPDIGDLRVNPDIGDADGDGDYEKLYAYGARSFSIWNGNTGELVYDSANQMATTVSKQIDPAYFNTRPKKGKWYPMDERSEKKGIEPEALAIGTVGANTYAYIGLEKQGGFFVYDITDPANASQVEYFNDINYSRTFNYDKHDATANVPADIDDMAPEGSEVFTQDSKQYYVNANEVSGTVSVFEISTADGKVTKKDTYYTGIYGESAAEIVEYDAKNKRLYVTDSAEVAVNVLDVSDVNDIKFVKKIDMTPYGTNVNSVAVHDGKIAVAVEISE